MRNELPREELQRRTSKFLKDAYQKTGFSRKEAADRGSVTEGYLSGLLVGRASVPGSTIIKSMAAGWGFNPIDFYKAVGWITEEDIRSYVSRSGLSNTTPSDVRLIHDRLAAMPVEKRRMVSQTLLSTLDTLSSPDEN